MVGCTEGLEERSVAVNLFKVKLPKLPKDTEFFK